MFPVNDKDGDIEHMFKKEDMYVHSRLISVEMIQPSRLQARLYFLTDANLEPKLKNGSIG